MISIVIPFILSRSGTAELRYCLRSIEKYLHGYGEIFVIGDDPKIDGVTHIHATDEPAYSHKEKNVFDKLLLACADPLVTDDFLYMNDDHYFLAHFEAAEFPYYYSSDWASGQGLYMNTVANTKAKYHCGRNFDIHSPMVMNKAGVKVLTKLNWNVKFGYCIKTAYAYENDVEGVYTKDLKISEPTLTIEQIKQQLQGRKWFSVGDFVFREGGMMEVMEGLYGQKVRA